MLRKLNETTNVFFMSTLFTRFCQLHSYIAFSL